LLRLNCEGVEDTVIYSVSESFGKKLKLVCGSLKDVEELKGTGAAESLDEFKPMFSKITENCQSCHQVYRSK